MYWCVASSDSPQMIRAKWCSLDNHIHDVHSGHSEIFSVCAHKQLLTVQKKWFKRGRFKLTPYEMHTYPTIDTKASEVLTKVIMNTMLCNDIQRLSAALQTSSLESFHSLIIQFAPKSHAFSYMGMLCRYVAISHCTYIRSIMYYVNACRQQLAALHFNENAARKQATTSTGESRYDIVFPKYKKGGYVVKKVIEDPTFGT